MQKKHPKIALRDKVVRMKESFSIMTSPNRQRRTGNGNEGNNNIAVLTHITQNTTTLLSQQQVSIRSKTFLTRS
jgi:hypothetical protein